MAESESDGQSAKKPEISQDISQLSDAEFILPEQQNMSAGQTDQVPANFMPPKPGKQSFLNKTAIDLDACRQVISRMVADKEVKVSEQSRTISAKPEQPIEQYRLATPCSTSWDSMSGTNRFRVCQNCSLNIYDFSSTDLSEAEALVFKREGINKPTFYRRKDGRFITADCPVGIRHGRTMLSLIVAGILLLLGLIALSLLMPHAAPPAAKPTIEADQVSPEPAVPHTVVEGDPESAKQPGSNATSAVAPARILPAPDPFPAGMPKPADSVSPSGDYVTVPKETLEEYKKTLEEVKQSMKQHQSSALDQVNVKSPLPSEKPAMVPEPVAPAAGPNPADPYVKNY